MQGERKEAEKESEVMKTGKMTKRDETRTKKATEMGIRSINDESKRVYVG